MTFGKECSEQMIKKNGEVHRADVLTKNNVVIELQNSPIQIDVISEREEFYGERMLWLINGSHFKSNFRIFDISKITDQIKYQSFSGRKGFKWNYARKSWAAVNRNVFIDFGTNILFWVRSGMGTKTGLGRPITKQDFILKYGGDYNYYQEQFELRQKEEEKRQLEIKRKEDSERRKSAAQVFINLTRRYRRKRY